jgi:hypothetical protein
MTLAVLLILPNICACSERVYTEELTPAGSVPDEMPTGQVPRQHTDSAQGRAPSERKGVSRQGSAAPTEVVAHRHESARRDRPAQLVRSGGIQLSDEDIERAKSHFSQAYAARGKPRLAFYLNRGLSPEVREWLTDHWQIASGEANDKGLSVGGLSTTVHHDGLGGDDVAATDAWLWEFEDGFRRPFEELAQVVDRTVMMRNVAAESGQQADIRATISVKQVETDALTKYADVLIEVRMADDANGVVFRAEAKDIKSSASLGRVTSVAWGDLTERLTSNHTIATDSGYENVSETITRYPPVAAIAQRLSIELMGDMAEHWD